MKLSRTQLAVQLLITLVMVVLLLTCGFLVGVNTANPELRANSAQISSLQLDLLQAEEELREARESLLEARARIQVRKGLVWELLVALLEGSGVDPGELEQSILRHSD